MADNNYTLGRGKLFFDPFAPGTKNRTGERYFGHTPEFSLAIESEKLDHFNADEGVREKDESVLLELNRTGSFTTDDISNENVALFLLADVNTVADAGANNVVETITGAIGGRWYQLGTSVNPSGVRNISIDSIVDDATPTPNAITQPTGYVATADDLKLGRIYIVPGGPADGENLTVTYDRAASNRTQIVTGANAEVEGSLRFISFNAQGDQRDYYFPYVRLTPSGDMALKGDEWQVAGFDVEILKYNTTTAAIYIDGRATNV